jgi:hypothetical protein
MSVKDLMDADREERRAAIIREHKLIEENRQLRAALAAYQRAAVAAPAPRDNSEQE